ncbi:hypothetical protein [Pelosinus propionicus]|uniref:hypothetical protein n=1 Tax=Pelosinus propionicus TaxID=380084 RepID=UPI0015873C59|nr:hypothetical protein [Pelosinus propionicus]
MFVVILRANLAGSSAVVDGTRGFVDFNASNSQNPLSHYINAEIAVCLVMDK